LEPGRARVSKGFVPDYFALLNETRRPWLDPQALKQHFLALTADAHPDRAHHLPPLERAVVNRRFAELNAAYQCLLEPKKRLLHLLELELGRRPDSVGGVPGGLLDWFSEIAQLGREADAFLGEKDQDASPLLKVQFFKRGSVLAERIQSGLRTLRSRNQARQDQLQALNDAWTSAAPVGSPQRAASLPLAQLEASCREISYLTRWIEQLEERYARVVS
jgi:curved DNA-binding protein CbpA